MVNLNWEEMCFVEHSPTVKQCLSVGYNGSVPAVYLARVSWDYTHIQINPAGNVNQVAASTYVEGNLDAEIKRKCDHG